MLALVNNRPEVLNLKQILHHFLEHRREVVVRRTIYELRKAEERAHILEGLKIALDNLDAVIALIRRSQSPDEARAGLMRQFSLTDIQANAILDMRLQRLTQLERAKLVEEYQEVLKQIEYLKSVLASEALVRSIIKDELTQLREDYKDDRKTQIVKEEAEISLEDLIAEEEVVVTISHAGYIKRNPVSLYRAQRRGGKGKIGMGIKDEDFVETLFTASTHDYAAVLHRCRQGLLAQSARDSGGQPSCEGQGAGESIGAYREREGHGDVSGKGLSRGPVCGHGHRERPHQEDGTLRLQQSTAGRHHRASTGRRRQTHRRAGHRWPTGNSVGTKQGITIRFSEATCGPWDGRPTASKASRSRKATKSSGWKQSPRLDDRHSHGDRGGVRQAHARRRIPRPGPWRQGHHQRQNHRAQRIGGRIPSGAGQR